MTRYIDADAVLKELKKSCEYHAENSRELSLLQRDIIIVQEQPTVDAVPVVRCKDCMWFSIDQLKSDGTPDMRCKPTWCSLHRTYAKAEFFCSWGNEG